ncbi:putative Multidrug resistance protein 1A [Seiridium cardinale]|uniref:Multidrug resistance protein 1A n=1 Tax=Seiridium cardinale TaxID=138064 RepID=A0ABR2XAK5_9PEZI
MILTSLERVSTSLIPVSMAVVAGYELFNVIDTAVPASGSLQLVISSDAFIFKDVTFEYPSRPGAKGLNALSFRIQHNRNTAMVSPSDQIKHYCQSAEAMVLHTRPVCCASGDQGQKLEQPREKGISDSDEKVLEESTVEQHPSGSISNGSYNLCDLDLKWWRSQIGFVQQEPFAFMNTIFNAVGD